VSKRTGGGCPAAGCQPNSSPSPAGPFPFNITTVPGSPQNTGLIRVIDDGPIDWNEL